jgi:hypothetical protein
MADTGESFNVARRKVEAAGQAPEGENSYRLIEVEVGTDAKFPDRPLNPRHVETFWGRWIIAPDTLADAHQLPEDIYRQAAPVPVLHRDI